MAGTRRRWRRWRSRAAARLVHSAWRRFQQAGTITSETDAGRTFAAFGAGSMIAFPTGAIFGERWIELGDRTLIGEQVSISAGMMPGHDLGPESVLRIGGGCVIGRGSHIVAHCSIDIGDDVYTGPYVYITDQNHSYADPALPVGRQWPVNSAVRIGDGCWLGTGVIVLPGSVLGRNVVVAAGSVVRGEFGDHCVIAGVPARLVKDFEPDAGWSRSRAEKVAAEVSALAAAERTVAADATPGADTLREALASAAEAMAADPLLASLPPAGAAAATAVPSGVPAASVVVVPALAVPAPSGRPQADAAAREFPAPGAPATAQSRSPDPAPGS
jgi:acetyltransferase-like isoleucine patch superfamily enzyme